MKHDELKAEKLTEVVDIDKKILEVKDELSAKLKSKH
jgi:hypothetical protein